MDNEKDVGYIAFTGGGVDQMSYSGREYWFDDYDSAMRFAIAEVKRKEIVNGKHEIKVYKAHKKMRKQPHSAPDDETRMCFKCTMYYPPLTNYPV